MEEIYDFYDFCIKTSIKPLGLLGIFTPSENDDFEEFSSFLQKYVKIYF